MAWAYPAGAFKWRTRPVALMPAIASAISKPVAIQPREAGPRRNRPHPHHPRSRWRSNANTQGNLRVHQRRSAQQYGEQEFFHGQVSSLAHLNTSPPALVSVSLIKEIPLNGSTRRTHFRAGLPNRQRHRQALKPLPTLYFRVPTTNPERSRSLSMAPRADVPRQLWNVSPLLVVESGIPTVIRENPRRPPIFAPLPPTPTRLRNSRWRCLWHASPPSEPRFPDNGSTHVVLEFAAKF